MEVWERGLCSRHWLTSYALILFSSFSLSPKFPFFLKWFVLHSEFFFFFFHLCAGPESYRSPKQGGCGGDLSLLPNAILKAWQPQGPGQRERCLTEMLGGPKRGAGLEKARKSLSHKGCLPFNKGRTVFPLWYCFSWFCYCRQYI